MGVESLPFYEIGASNSSTDFIDAWFDDPSNSLMNHNFLRVSDGNRYNENLLPTIQDKTVQVPGGDGAYYYGSYYTNRQVNIPIAFDNARDSDINWLKNILGDKKYHKMFFSEHDDRYLLVKGTGSPQLKYIVFDAEWTQDNPDRIYKGEGTLNFIAYDPFWTIESIPPQQQSTSFTYLQNINDYNKYSMFFQVDQTSFQLLSEQQLSNIEFYAGQSGSKKFSFVSKRLYEAMIESGDRGLFIDQKTQLIFGLDSQAFSASAANINTHKTNNIYNNIQSICNFEQLPQQTSQNFSTVSPVNATLGVIIQNKEL